MLSLTDATPIDALAEHHPARSRSAIGMIVVISPLSLPAHQLTN